MISQRYSTKDGFPAIAWEQEYATGQTVAARERDRRIKIGAWTGFVAMCMATLAWDVLAGLLAGVLVGGMVAAPGPYRIQIGFFGQHVAGPWERTKAEEALAARKEVTPFYQREHCRAEVHLDQATRRPHLRLWRGSAKADELVFDVPLEQLDELLLGEAQDWFANVAERELMRTRRIPEQWVIVAPARDLRLLLVARSGRDRASLAELHNALLTAFIGRRKEILRKAEEHHAP